MKNKQLPQQKKKKKKKKAERKKSSFQKWEPLHIGETELWFTECIGS